MNRWIEGQMDRGIEKQMNRGAEEWRDRLIEQYWHEKTHLVFCTSTLEDGRRLSTPSPERHWTIRYRNRQDQREGTEGEREMILQMQTTVDYNRDYCRLLQAQTDNCRDYYDEQRNRAIDEQRHRWIDEQRNRWIEGQRNRWIDEQRDR